MITAAEALAAIAALPVRPLSHLIEAGPPLILAPHPDDESLGCGGIIAACSAVGAPPFVVIVTDGAGSHPNSRAYPAARLRAIRMQEARDAVAALGLPPERIAFLNLPDTDSPSSGPAFDAAIDEVAALLRQHRLGSILATWRHDPHCDHLSAHHIASALAACTRTRHLAYPVWGLTLPPDAPLDGQAPQGFRLDIAAHLPAKRRAIAAHRSQYAGLIDDDPSGFQLADGFLALFDGPFETLLEPE
jgi:LmbE family N-acetylglucosaminyl deacetylase